MEALIKKTKKKIKKEFKHHPRPDSEFRNRYRHTLRVLKWAERLHKIEGGDFDTISMAVLLHDIGWEKDRPHNEVSYAYTRKYLKKKEMDTSKKESICNAVLKHNQRHIPNKDLTIEEKIVMDADILDEMGILSIIWDSLSTALKGDDVNYYSVHEKIKQIHQSGYAAREKELKTPTGLAFYRERVVVYEKAIANLEYELCLTEENPETELT
jgi:uncharacterized protein